MPHKNQFPVVLPPELELPAVVVVGVSGGADSVALLHWLSGHPDLTLHVAHFDHALRPESGDEAEWVRSFAEKLHLPFHLARSPINLRTVAGQSVEEAARNARYCFLGQVAQNVAAQAVVVAHHQDDQAETVLMHLLRGSGLAGLRGMLPAQPLDALQVPDCSLPKVWLLRPLLAVTRAEIEAYCAAQGLPYLTDPSNQDRTYFRNRLRHELLPQLAEFNPNIAAVLARTAAVLAADYAVIDAVVSHFWQVGVAVTDNGLRIDWPQFAAAPVGVQRAVLRRAVFKLRPTLRDVPFTPISQAVDWLTHSAQIGQQTHLPGGVQLTCDRDNLYLAITEGLPPATGWPWLPAGVTVAVTAPGSLVLPGCGWQLTVTALPTPNLAAITHNPDPYTAYIAADAVEQNWQLRHAQPAERFQPLGLAGHSQALTDFFTNQQVPLAVRQHLPLLVAGEQIMWLPGLRIDERVKVTANSQMVWRVQLTP